MLPSTNTSPGDEPQTPLNVSFIPTSTSVHAFPS